MTQLIAVTEVQIPVDGKLAKVAPGSPLVVTDAGISAYLLDIDAVRHPTDDEKSNLFKGDVISPTDQPLGIPADLAKLSKADLVTIARNNGITVDDAMTKADLVSAIESQDDEAL